MFIKLQKKVQLTKPSRRSSAGRTSVLLHAVRQQHAYSWTRAPPILVCKCVDEMAQLPCWSPRGHIRGESEKSVACRQWSIQERRFTLALKPRGDVTRSPKRGICGPTKRTYVLQIIFKKTSTVDNIACHKKQ